MSLFTYSFHVTTGNDPTALLAMMFKAMGIAYTPTVAITDEHEQYTKPLGFIAAADWTVDDRIGGTWLMEYFNEYFGISPNVGITFWDTVTEEQDVDVFETILRGTVELLKQLPGDAIFRAEDAVLLYRKDGHLYVSSSSEWRSKDLALITLPYDVKPIRS